MHVIGETFHIAKSSLLLVEYCMLLVKLKLWLHCKVRAIDEICHGEKISAYTVFKQCDHNQREIVDGMLKLDRDSLSVTTNFPKNDEGSLDRQLDLETYLGDASIGYSNPPQGEMNLDWMGLYLSARAKYSRIISFG